MLFVVNAEALFFSLNLAYIKKKVRTHAHDALYA